MSASTGSLVVNFNYRLGPLGFLCLNAVSSSANSPASGAEQEGVKGEGEGEGEGEGLCRGGMNGLNDALTALKWIKNNIHVYGGDPSSVGLFGESSGGLAVCTLSLSPAASGLFSHSIVQSGPCNVPYPEGW
jgi:para-nitrobenzyl esterase